MKYRKLVIALAMGLVGGTACGGGDDGGADKDVTFDALPEAARAQFEAWKAQPIKACAWEQAFPSLAEQYPPPSGSGVAPGPRVDLTRVLAENQGSPLLSNAQGELILLGAPAVDSLSSTHAHESSRTVNGRTERFKISSNLEQGMCVVSLGDEELYRAALAAAVPVVLSLDAEALAPAGVDLLPMQDAIDGEPIARSDGSRLLRHAIAALAPTARAQAKLAARYQITAAVSAELFPIGSPERPRLARLLTPAGATPFEPFAAAQLFGTRAQLQPLYDGSAAVVELLFGGLPDARLALRAELTSSAGGKGVKAAKISVAPEVPFDDAAMLTCFAQREAAKHFESGQVRSPAFDEQYLGCAFLAKDGFAALAASPTGRAAVTAQAMRAGGVSYRGWDAAIIEVAKRAHELGLDLSALGELAEVLGNWRVLRQGAASLPASAKAALERAAIELAFRWHFNALLPSSSFVQDVAAALGNAGNGFAVSVERMMSDVARDLSAAGAGARAARCGQALVAARRAAVDRAVSAAALVPYASSFVGSFSAELLQTCPSEASLAALEASAAAVNTFITADSQRAGGSATFSLAAADLVEHALEQRWSTATFAALPDVLDYAAASKYTFCGLNPTRAQQAVCVDSSFELLGTGDGGLLAPAVAPRYAELAKTLTARWPALSGATFVTARFDLQDAYFEGMWLGCSDAGFARSRTKLLDLITALLAAPTFDARFDIEEELRALEQAATCP